MSKVELNTLRLKQLIWDEMYKAMSKSPININTYDNLVIVKEMYNLFMKELSNNSNISLDFSPKVW